MVELATFRMFHRAAPARQPEPPPEEHDVPVAPASEAPEPPPVDAAPEIEAPLAAPAPSPVEESPPAEVLAHVDEAPSTQFSQELRARRRAARTDMRQSGAWAEPETPPSGLSLAESVAFVSEASPPAEPVEPEPEVAEHAHEHPVDEAIAAAEEPAVDAAEAEIAPETGEHLPPAETGTAHASWPDFAEEHAAPPSDLPAPVEEVAEETHPVHVAPEAEPEVFEAEHEAHTESAAAHEDEAAALPDESHPHAAFEPEAAAFTPEEETGLALDSADAHPVPPTPITEYLRAAADEPPTEPHIDQPIAEAEALTPLYTEAPAEEPWPIEPPSTLFNQHALPIEPPAPFVSDVEAEPPVGKALPMLDEFHSDSLDLDYRLLGLANPKVCTVFGKLGDATPTQMSVGGAGIYRPDGFRPAPWSGFAYDISPDGRTGLVLGTRILTARGEIPVEDLIPGDTALALRGPALLPIVWIGRSVASPSPVEIDAGAFGPGRPGRSLRVGADHPIFMETMPVAARDLVNGETIRNVDSETEELFHVDVGYAEVLLAEGIPLASGSR